MNQIELIKQQKLSEELTRRLLETVQQQIEEFDEEMEQGIEATVVFACLKTAGILTMIATEGNEKRTMEIMKKGIEQPIRAAIVVWEDYKEVM